MNTKSTITTPTMTSVKKVCTPVVIYIIISLIILCSMSCMIMSSNNNQKWNELMPHILGMIICTIILWLLCAYVSTTASWVLLIILLIFPLCMFCSFVSALTGIMGFMAGNATRTVVSADMANNAINQAMKQEMMY